MAAHTTSAARAARRSSTPSPTGTSTRSDDRRSRSSTPATSVEPEPPCPRRGLAVGRWAAQALRLAALPLLLQASLPCGGRRFGRTALPLDLQGVPQGLDDALDRELAVSPLAAFVLGDGAEHRAGLREHAPLLSVGQRDRALDVEDRLGAGLGLLRVLSAGPAGAREAELDLGAWDGDRPGDPNRLAGHGYATRPVSPERGCGSRCAIVARAI